MEQSVLVQKILNAPRRQYWRTVEADGERFEFLVERLTRMDLMRQRDACVELRHVAVEGNQRGQVVEHVSATALMARKLGAVRGWRGVRAGDLVPPGTLTDAEAAEEVPFSHPLLDRLLSDRLGLTMALLRSIDEQAFAATEEAEASRGN